jgi:hypothetical protein
MGSISLLDRFSLVLLKVSQETIYCISVFRWYICPHVTIQTANLYKTQNCITTQNFVNAFWF